MEECKGQKPKCRVQHASNQWSVQRVKFKMQQLHFALCTDNLHFAVCTLKSFCTLTVALCTLLFGALCTNHLHFALWTLPLALFTLCTTICILLSANYSLHFKLCTDHLHFALCTLHFTLCTVHFALITCTFHSALCTLHFSLCNLHLALCSLQG